MSLRDALLRSLESLPGKRTFHLHVLVTSPRKYSGLFPYARPRPRAFLQDLLILVSEQLPDEHASPVFVSAIEASVSTLSATDAAVLYVAKVDSTGQGTAPAPTAALVRGLLAFYADVRTRPLRARHLWIHVFARAQSQYLFPNSADFARKRMLSDIRLCAWWKRLLEQTATAAQDSFYSGEVVPSVHLSYLLPGMIEAEAARALQVAAQSTVAPPALPLSSQPSVWAYGQPFPSSSGIPLPCPPPIDGHPSLAHLIPYFEDDPKSRFLDELACTGDTPGVRSPPPKRRKLAKDGADDANDDDVPARARGELARVPAPEFWERLAFRQECVAGAIAGFFALAVSVPPTPGAAAAPAHAPAPIASPGEVSVPVYRRVLATLTTANEFSTTERAVRATAAIERAIHSLCEASGELAPVPTASPAPALPNSSDAGRIHTSEPPASPTPLVSPQTPPRAATARAFSEDTSPNPPLELAPTSDSYTAYIYGTIHIDNPSIEPRASAESAAAVNAPVTLLTARKKKRADV